MDDIISALAAARGGYFFRADALKAGLDDRFLSSALRTGQAKRIRHGAYAPAALVARNTPYQNFLLLARAVLTRLGPGAVLSHDSAVYVLTKNDWGLDLTEIQVTFLDRRPRRREAGIVPHLGAATEDDVVWVEGIPVMRPSRAAVELASLRSVEVGMVHSSLILHAGLAHPEELLADLTDFRHWPGMAKARLSIGYAEPRCESVGEVRSMYTFRRFQVPLPEPQVVIHDAAGRFIARVDFEWIAYRHIGEFDGHGKYGLDPAGSAASVLKEKWREDEVRATLRGASRWGWVHLGHGETLAARIKYDLERSRKLYVVSGLVL